MTGFVYRLYLENGEGIGTFRTAVPDWDIGMTFITGDHVTFENRETSFPSWGRASSSECSSSLRSG